MKILNFEDQYLVEEECRDCVKFRGDHCLVLSEFYCLAKNGKSCPAKETNLLKWKKTLSDMVEYNTTHGSYIENEWIFEELKKLEEKMSSEIDQCRFEEEHKPIKKGKSESGRDKSYKRRGKQTDRSDDELFPDFR